MNNKFPEPEVPLEQAWDKMKGMLDKTPVSIKANKTFSKSFKNYLISGSGLLIISIAVLFYINNKSKRNDSTSVIHKTSTIPVKDNLSNGIIAFIDQQSILKENIDKTNKGVVEINGAAYFQGTSNSDETTALKAGQLIVQGWRGNLFVAFKSDSNISVVQVQSGSAEVTAGSTTFNVKAGESVRYYANNGHIEHLQTTDPNPSSYATKIFDFTDMPLKTATEYLEKAYGVKFIFQNGDLANCRITTRFDNKSLEEIIDVMSFTLGFEYKIDAKKNIVYLSGKVCE